MIIDGTVLDKNLELSGKDRPWLDKALKSHGVGDIRTVGLATLDKQGELSVYKKM